ncbi:hypothetical protein C5F48_23700 [Cereibacter changlensis JA139]|uniref:Uncharacterized protein n=2 Tax=Cereibacter changlensis TaxID=402884 RepID=A0A2T4JKC6_9RHOB|nr:hypothetical protein [Cereibacter changlensis]PTE18380.1 hypothetical protein C5F48_23700 [Cereibacter changlensis JA139]PZX47601.1 hypothetical protein LX76_04470 [Cereibacter changlensis]
MIDRPAPEALTPDQITALVDYARQHGRSWKSRLAREWRAVSASADLHRLRNTHDPAWLTTFRLDSLTRKG